MKFWILLLMSSYQFAFAEDLTIVDVRRNITLSEDEVPYKDFYISTGGGSAGLKKNLVVTAMRNVAVRDSSGAQAYGEITIPVGQLRVIAIYNKVAVAREYKLLSRDELPMLEQVGIMTGDKIDLQGAFVDNSKPVTPLKKHPRAENEIKTNVTAAVVTANSSMLAAPNSTLANNPSAAPAALETTAAPAAAMATPPTTTTSVPATSANLVPTPAAVPVSMPVQKLQATPPAAPTAVGPTPASVGDTVAKSSEQASQKLDKTDNPGENTAL